jgi:RDD family
MKRLPVTRLTAFIVCAIILSAMVWASRGGSVSAQRYNNDYIMRASLSPIALIGGICLGLFAFLFRSKNQPLHYIPRVPLWRRLISFYIDIIIALAIAVPFDILLILLVESFYTGKFSWQFQRQGVRDYDATFGIFATFLTMGWFLFYLSYPIAKGRQTIGHFIMRYRIANKQSSISLTKATWHSVLGFLVLCVWIISVPLAACDSKKQLFHESDNDFFPELLKYD